MFENRGVVTQSNRRNRNKNCDISSRDRLKFSMIHVVDIVSENLRNHNII